MMWRVPIAILVIASTVLRAQAPVPRSSSSATADVAFEVASVKRNVSGETMSRFQVPPAGTVNITNATLRQLIERAHSLDPRMTRSTLIVPANNSLVRGGDLREDMAAPRFDIQGKIPDGAEPGSSIAMLRTLLSDRFKLRVHWETRGELPVYALTVAREGRLGPALRTTQVDCAVYGAERRKNPELKPPAGADGHPVCTTWFEKPITTGKITLRSAGRFNTLVSELQPMLSRPIVDRTGLSGLFEWTLSLAVISEDPAFDTREAGVLQAVRDQLGLRLAPTTAPFEVLVVDSVEMPTEN